MTRIIMSIGVLIFCGILINVGNVFAYENQTSTVVKNYDAWYDFYGYGYSFRKLTDGYVSVAHNVNVTLALQNGDVEVCDPFSFSYSPTIFFTATDGGTWDTPYGIWKNSIDAALTGNQIKGSHGQRVWSAADGGTSRPGDISWSAVAPTPVFSSSDENVVTCNDQGECEAVNTGTTTITVNIPETQARLWGIIYPVEQGWYPTTMRVFYNKHTYTLSKKNGDAINKTFSTELQSVSGKDNRDDGILILPSPVTPMSWDVTVVPDVNPTGECALADGRCNPDIDGTPIEEYPTGDLCCEIKNGETECVPTDKYESIVTDNGDGTYSWTCAGVYGGDEAECKTIRNDCAACHSDANGVYTDVKPTGDLCIVGTATSAEMNSEGKWLWDCEFLAGNGDCKSAACEAPSCFSDNPLTANPQFIYEGEGTEKVVISMTCPLESSDNVCCTIGSPEDGVQICSDENTTTEIEVPKDASQTQIDAVCGGASYSLTIQTMCTAKSCNAQGTCQVMPFPSGSEKCTSTCNSSADCSSGRLIETKP